MVIIDEWDVLIRDNANNKKLLEEYIDFLKGLFKGSQPSRYIALAYLMYFTNQKNDDTVRIE